MNRQRSVVSALAGLVAALAITACGVGAESEPREIDRAAVPFGLAVRPAVPATTPDQAPYSFTIYLVAGDRLRAVPRGSETRPSRLEELHRLLDGPTPAEADAGLRTLLAPDLTVDDVRVAGDVATVALSGAGAAQPSGSERTLAVAQLVYTATALPGVDRVRFEVDGAPAEIPRGDGTLSNGAVGRDDYAFAIA